jgi:hypothetical protein
MFERLAVPSHVRCTVAHTHSDSHKPCLSQAAAYSSTVLLVEQANVNERLISQTSEESQAAATMPDFEDMKSWQVAV